MIAHELGLPAVDKTLDSNGSITYTDSKDLYAKST
jgi:hypothetical protein